MNKCLMYATLMAFTCACAQADEWYRWKDESGNVHYGDTPAANAQKNKFNASSPDQDAGLPYETRRAKQTFPVTLYVVEDCGDVCQQARQFLNKRGIPFAEKVLKTKEEYEAFRQTSGSSGAPTLSVGKVWLGGFREKQWNDELDAAGYPKVPQ